MTDLENKTLSAKETELDDEQDIEIDLEKDGDSIVGGQRSPSVYGAGAADGVILVTQ